MSASFPSFSLRRVGVLGAATFTQLVRMKVLWFLAALFLLLGAFGFLSASLSSSLTQQLTTLKSVTLFTMGLFTELLAIAATAMLIPRDIEDRTLYTILCRPVPRIEYLLGKFLGILALLGVTLLVMGLLLNLSLWWRQTVVIDLQLDQLRQMNVGEDAILAEKERLESLGVTWGLQAGAGMIFLRASLMAALTLLLSCVSSSALFTQVNAVGVYFIGHLVAMARTEALTGDSWFTRTMVGTVAMVFPDLQLLNLNDAITQGQEIGGGMLLRLFGIGSAYIIVYLLLAWFVFSEREY